jgi:hypothetical protein
MPRTASKDMVTIAAQELTYALTCGSLQHNRRSPIVSFKADRSDL